jgi:hypothetical protein
MTICQPMKSFRADQLRTIYEEMFGEAPHKNTSAKTLKEKIDERRKELGV